MIKFSFVLVILCSNLLFGEYYFVNKQKVYIKKSISRSSGITYKSSLNAELTISKNIIIGFKNIKSKEKIILKYKLKEIEKLYKNSYLFEVENINKTLDTANKIYEQERKNGNILFSHPDFKKTIFKRTLDPFYKKAWHLHNDIPNAHINIEGAFTYTKGAGVKVGVYDDGLDSLHEDLKDNVHLSLFSNLYSPASFSFLKKHGTQVAGLISAVENDKGSVGVAPKSKLYFIQYNFTGKSVDSEISRVFNYLNNKGVSIIINSWGTYQASDLFYYLVRDLAINGRHGKGLIIIFASGNDQYNYDAETRLIDESESPYVLSVSAVTRQGKFAKSYSNYGSSIDIAAPGGTYRDNDFSKKGLVTTSVYSKYIHDFIGTSASAPIVAGSIALALSINPDLSRTEILDMLDKTSTKIDTPKKVGYGLINAEKLVIASINSYKTHLKGKSFPIKGEFIYDKSEFLFKDYKNGFYGLDLDKVTPSNPYGFYLTNKISVKSPSFYLAKIRNKNNDSLNVQDLILINAKDMLIYKSTKLDKNFIAYSFALDMNAYLSKTRNSDKKIKFP